MAYTSDKDVIFSFMQRVNYNLPWTEIEHNLGYDFGDYYFGDGDSPELRKKITESIKFMKIQFDQVFDKESNTKVLL